MNYDEIIGLESDFEVAFGGSASAFGDVKMPMPGSWMESSFGSFTQVEHPLQGGSMRSRERHVHLKGFAAIGSRSEAFR